MESLRHAFTKSRSSSNTSSPPLSAKPRDSAIGDGGGVAGKSLQRGEAKRDSAGAGLGKTVLGSLGSSSGRKHSRTASGASSRSMDHSFVSTGSLNVSDRLEAVLARTDEVDAVNVAHLAQSISEMRGKSHGVHGIHPGMLASDISPPGSSHGRSPSQQEFVHFSPSTIARTRKVKADFEVRMTAMRLYQQDGKSWNPLQCLRDREVRRLSGEPLDTHFLEGRTRESSKAGSVSSFAATDSSLGEGRTSRGRKRHSSPVQPPQRGHTRQQSSRHQHAERYRMLPKGLENWSLTSEEVLSNYAWQQSNPNRMINRHYQLINPPTDDERRSDGVASKSSSFEYTRARYSSETVPLSPQVSHGSPLGRTTSAKATHLRNVPSFAMSSTSVNRSRSPSPVRGNSKHTRQTSDLLDIPQRVRKKIQNRIKGDRSGVSSRAHSPTRSETVPLSHSIQEDLDTSKTPRAVTMPNNLRLDIDVLARRPTISRRPKPAISTQETESKRELARTRARLISTGVTTRAMLPSQESTSILPIMSCQNLMNKFHDLDRSLTASFEHDFPQATSDLLSVLSTVESRQTQISNKVSSSLTKTRTETAVKIAEIASEQTSTLLLQLKAVEDKMDALEYRTNSGWTHEKTLHLVFLLLEYIVMVVLWHLWVLISVLQYGKRAIYGVWGILWGIVMGSIRLVRWMFFL